MKEPGKVRKEEFEGTTDLEKRKLKEPGKVRKEKIEGTRES